ncbi:unnamed protein product [Acanthoscelides obtectus]|uniref:Uncharacterized protein n=2 Tax=Acanthoscelides obtectus TaxID=200917 RepID=A0A9P0KWX1_ACAOB|nr:unnamed protein product [Acanthoscelides obtectus]CAH2013184.1 unnamed protein product [Acanthoscelides obtectus]CAK1677628.1 Flexible cuticle protein 12 [Acanthoscelides obtectus]CAK1677633.1 Flexible cuticle protein 12 [Acanthoscelides obtectus]
MRVLLIPMLAAFATAAPQFQQPQQYNPYNPFATVTTQRPFQRQPFGQQPFQRFQPTQPPQPVQPAVHSAQPAVSFARHVQEQQQHGQWVPTAEQQAQQAQIEAANDKSRAAQILHYANDNIGADTYSYAIDQSDGITKNEDGQVVNPGTDNESIAVRGQYSYVGPDGVVYTVTYIADENGFQPQGAHIPQAPQ